MEANKKQICINVDKPEGYDLIPETVGYKEIMELLGISFPTLIKRRNEGMVPFIKFGSSFRYIIPKGGKNE